MMLFVFSSCNLFNKGRRDDKNVIILQPDKKDTAQAENKINKEENKKENKKETEVTAGKKWLKKDSYNIAYILPFEFDAVELNTLLNEDKITGYQPLASIEFYEGALLALDTLKKAGLNLNIYVYDNEKDSAATKELMNKPEMKTMDLLIGPVFNQSLKPAAEFAKQNEVFTISPLSPASNITSDNSFYILANTTLNTQFKKMIQYFFKKDKNANIILAYRNDNENEKKMAAEFKKVFTAENSWGTVKDGFDAEAIENYINKTVQNYIFILSADEFYVNGIMRDLSKISRGSENINAVGLPSLLNIETISVDYFENLNFHYPASYWVDPNAPRTQRFKKAFAEKYGSYPTEFATKGYDITLFFGYLLKTYGPNIAENINKPVPVKDALYQFNFSPSRTEDNKIKFFENDNVIILKYDNYRFEKVN